MDGASSTSEPGTNASTQPPVIPIDPTGDLLLDVTFETSKSTLKAARAAAARRNKTAAGGTHVRLFFRVSRAQLRGHSRYFAKLLDVDATRFQEARDVAAALARLAARGVDPAAADAADPDLPRVAIVDDDEATRYAGREAVFADLLRILHGREVAAFAAVGGNGVGKDGDGDEKEGEKGEGGGGGSGSRNEKVESSTQKKKKSATITATTTIDTTPIKTTRTTKVTHGGKGALSSPRQKQQQQQQQQPQEELQRQGQQKKKHPHPKPVAAATPTVGLPYVVTLAVLADRFDCTATVSRWLTSAGPRVKWPVTSHSSTTTTTSRTPAAAAAPASSTRDGGGDSMTIAPSMSRTTEELLRQKILVSWLLDQPVRFQNATRELILNGSCRWGPLFGVDGEGYGEEGGDDEEAMGTSWWYLPDGLEQELQYRRHSILNTIGSIQQHFLRLYSTTATTTTATTAPLSRGGGRRQHRQQCQLGYDSSAACDSYQLGEMVKFLVSRGLLGFADCSPGSLDGLPDAARWPVDALLAALRQCPAYQVDKHHANCGLRTRLLPILDFVRGLLSAGSVPVSGAAWRGDRAAAAWMPPSWLADGGGGLHGNHGNGSSRWQGAGADGAGAGAGADGVGPRQFRFTRSLLSDQRLRFENALGADKFARDVFTASSWDWTAED